MSRYPTGFSPFEISSLINGEVVSMHAEEAAFLWTQRHRAVGEPHYSLKDLEGLDGRVDAHLSGLTNAGDTGWKICKAAAEAGEAGEMFACALLAFSEGNRERMGQVVMAGSTSTALSRAVVSALGWLDYDRVSPWILTLLTAKSATHRFIGLSASAVHREDPGDQLVEALKDSDIALRARALRATGELKRKELLNGVSGHLHDQDGECRFWAAWSLALNRQPDGLNALREYLVRNDSVTERAMHVALRAMTLEESRSWISGVSGRPEFARLCVLATGIVGDPASVPWLVRKMESPELARVAGEAFSMITGVDLAFADLDQDPSPPAESAEETPLDVTPELDYESNLRWPSPERVAKWWHENQHKFQPGTRFLAGKPITLRSALDVLVTGKQRQRTAAALEVALRDPDSVLFEVRGRGACQRRKLQSWTS